MPLDKKAVTISTEQKEQAVGEIIKYLQLVFEEENKIESKRESQKKMEEEERTLDLHAQVSKLEEERRLLKHLADIGVAVRRRRLQRKCFSGPKNRVVIDEGNKAAHDDNIDADAGLPSGGFEDSDEASTFKYLHNLSTSSYSQKPQSDQWVVKEQEVRGLWMTWDRS